MPMQLYLKKQFLKPFTYEAKELGPWDIGIEISHCGICHSDLHLIDNDWNISQFPLVPGHEIIGTVKEVGANISHLKKDDRVGVGWQCSSCMECEWCMSGEEQLCLEGKATCANQFGGYADYIRTDGRICFLHSSSTTFRIHSSPSLRWSYCVYSSYAV